MILFIDQSGAMGGAQTVLLSLLRAALAVTDNVTVLAPQGALETEIARRFGTSVRFVPCEEPRLQRGSKGLGDILAMLGYTWRLVRHLPLLRAQRLVYVNGSRQLPSLLLLAPLFRRRAIYHIHTEFGRLEKIAIHLAARWPNTAALVSNSRFIAGRLGVASTVIENALDESFAALPFVDRFSSSPETFRAAVVGTLAPQKGQDTAAKAIQGLPLTLHLLGQPAIGTAAWLQGLQQPGVVQEGVTDSVPAALDRMNIHFNLVPSACEEAFGLAAIEGMACSAVTIVSGRGGLAEIAARTGALMAPDADSLAATLAELVRRPAADLARLAQAQHAATLAHYAPARFQAEAADLFRRALGTL